MVQCKEIALPCRILHIVKQKMLGCDQLLDILYAYRSHEVGSCQITTPHTRLQTHKPCAKPKPKPRRDAAEPRQPLRIYANTLDASAMEIQIQIIQAYQPHTINMHVHSPPAHNIYNITRNSTKRPFLAAPLRARNPTLTRLPRFWRSSCSKVPLWSEGTRCHLSGRATPASRNRSRRATQAAEKQSPPLVRGYAMLSLRPGKPCEQEPVAENCSRAFSKAPLWPEGARCYSSGRANLRALSRWPSRWSSSFRQTASP